MRLHTHVTYNVEVEAVEAPYVASGVVETNEPRGANSASKRAPKKPKVITVSFDSTTLCSDGEAPPEEQTEQQPEPKP